MFHLVGVGVWVSMRTYAPQIRIAREFIQIKKTGTSTREPCFADQLCQTTVELSARVAKRSNSVPREIFKPSLAIRDLSPGLFARHRIEHNMAHRMAAQFETPRQLSQATSFQNGPLRIL